MLLSLLLTCSLFFSYAYKEKSKLAYVNPGVRLKSSLPCRAERARCFGAARLSMTASWARLSMTPPIPVILSAAKNLVTRRTRQDAEVLPTSE